MNHLLDFPGKMCNLRLVLLHGFGGCATLTYARILHLRLNELKGERPPHVVVARIHGMDSTLEHPVEGS